MFPCSRGIGRRDFLPQLPHAGVTDDAARCDYYHRIGYDLAVGRVPAEG